MRTIVGAAATLFTLTLAQAAPAAGLKLQRIDVPPGATTWIAPGPDGNIWFTNDNAGNYIGRVTMRGKVTAFPIATPSAHPDTIVRGPDGALWSTSCATRTGSSASPRADRRTEFAVPNANSTPRGIAPRARRRAWVTEFNGGKIGRLTTSGQFTEFPIPGGGLPRERRARP